MGGRSGEKRNKGLYYTGGGLKKVIYEEEINGITIIRVRFEQKKQKKRRNK